MAQQFDVTQSLFGFSPQQLEQQMQQQRQEQAFKLAQNPVAGYGALGVPRIQQAADTIKSGVFGIEDPRMIKAKAMSAARQKAAPAFQQGGIVGFLESYAAELESLGMTEEALLARRQAQQEMMKQQESQATIGLKKAQAAKAGQEQGPKFANEVDKALYEDFLIKAGGNAGVAARMYSEYKSGLRQKEAKAGVPESGAVKIQDIASANKIISELVDTPKQKLSTVADVRTQLNLVRKGEGAALPQLQRQLIKLVGDSQIAQGEVRAALGSAGIVGDTINAVNQFMTGTPTADKLDSVEKVINALEEINADAYNRGRNRAATVINEAAFSDQTKKALLPPEYKTGKQKKTQFVEGKIYTDAKGNRARYVNGKWEPVQ